MGPSKQGCARRKWLSKSAIASNAPVIGASASAGRAHPIRSFSVKMMLGRMTQIHTVGTFPSISLRCQEGGDHANGTNLQDSPPRRGFALDSLVCVGLQFRDAKSRFEWHGSGRDLHPAAEVGNHGIYWTNAESLSDMGGATSHPAYKKGIT